MACRRGRTNTARLRSRIPGALGDVFGADATDVYPVEKPYSVTAANEQAGELWNLPLVMKGGQILVRDRDGKPFAVRHPFGKGQGYLLRQRADACLPPQE